MQRLFAFSFVLMNMCQLFMALCKYIQVSVDLHFKPPQRWSASVVVIFKEEAPTEGTALNNPGFLHGHPLTKMPLCYILKHWKEQNRVTRLVVISNLPGEAVCPFSEAIHFCGTALLLLVILKCGILHIIICYLFTT